MPGIIRLTIILSIGFGFQNNVLASDIDAEKISQKGLSAEQARQVLIVALEQLHFKLSKIGMYIDGPLTDAEGKPFRVGFYDFGLAFDSPTAGATDVLGHYAVNTMTGDVWETERCVRYKFPELLIIQKRITEKTATKLLNEEKARDEIGC
jgi:hypothetical protein